MIFAALSEAADRAELLLVDNGLCRYHRRKDGVVVVREILVLPAARRCGVGSGLIKTVRRLYPGALIRARCPVADARGTVGSGNVFWRHMGFTLVRVEGGKLNVWEWRPCG